MTACREYDENYTLDTVPITFYLQTSGAHHTRAYIGDVAADDGESTIHTVKVWFFAQNAADDALAVAYSEDLVVETDVNKVTINVPRAIASSTVDAYIIANAESVGLGGNDGLKKTTPLGQIKSAVLKGTNFTGNPLTTSVPDAGLPMSRIENGLDLSTLREVGATTPELKTIKLTRAVSKVYFAFGMYDGDFGEIVSIKLEDETGLVAKSEYILPVDPATNAADYTDPYFGDLKSNIKTADGYETTTITFQGTGTNPLYASNAIPKTSSSSINPADYAWTNWIATTEHSALSNQQKATQYYTDIAPFVKQKLYLRESAKKLKGTITYRYSIPNGEDDPTVIGPKTITFEMDAPHAETETAPADPTQDFARNHVWIVYAYFEGGQLYVNPTIADWIDAPVLNYTLKMNTNMRLFDSWLYRYDTVDQDYSNWTNWAGSHMVVSEGRVTTATETEPVTGRPLRSPQIQLITTGVADASVAGSGTFELYVDNDDFEIVRANKNDVGVVTSYDASTNGTLTIPAGDDVYTYFYVVPKEGVTPSDPVAHVFLYYNDPVLGKVKVTYNYSSLPGYSDDSSEIWVYYVPAGEYNITGKLKMYYQDYNNPLVPTPVQN